MICMPAYGQHESNMRPEYFEISRLSVLWEEKNTFHLCSLNMLIIIQI